MKQRLEHVPLKIELIDYIEMMIHCTRGDTGKSEFLWGVRICDILITQSVVHRQKGRLLKIYKLNTILDLLN